MRHTMRGSLCIAALGVLWLAPYAVADSVSMVLTGAGPNVMGGVYVGAYNATINGVSTKVICDDFADDTYLNESWTASVTDFSHLSGTKWKSPSLYNEAAWLSLQMLSASDPTTVGEIHYAIWGLFNSDAITDLGAVNAGYAHAAQDWIGQGAAHTTGDFSNFLVYTPDSGSARCNGGPCRTPPQEFLAVRVPESPFLITFAGDMLALGLIAALLRRLVPRRPLS